MKTRYRLAKAQMGQREWAAAAHTVDQALLVLKGSMSSRAVEHLKDYTTDEVSASKWFLICTANHQSCQND